MQEIVKLTTPIRIGDNEYSEITLREPTAGDVIEAQEEAEKLVMTPDGPALVASPSKVGLGVLRRQVAKIGDTIDGPADITTLKRLTPIDLNRLQNAADAMDAALDAEVAAALVDRRGRAGGQDG
jgi:phage FluMu protein gp41